MNKHEVDTELAVKHMRHVVSAAMQYQRTPIQRLREDAARTARVEAKVLRDLADLSGDKSLLWAANEAELVVKNVFK